MSDRLRNIQDIGANVAINAINNDLNTNIKPSSDVMIPMAQFQDESDGSLMQ